VEELIRLDPDQVLIIPPPDASLEARRRMLAAFNELSPLRAVKEARVGTLSGATQSVGPSILSLVDSIARGVQQLSGPTPRGGFVE
jgi:hypothetical protein